MEKEYLRSCPHCELGLASERTDQGTKFTCGSIINDFTEEWVYASPLCDDISQLRRHFIDFCKKENRECVVIEYTGQDYKVMLGTSILSRGTMEQCIEYCEAAERPFLIAREEY